MTNKKKEIPELTLEGLKIGALVEYQPGAVVSRTLIDKAAGTVTLFAFAAGEGLSEHSAPFDALVQILEGRAEIRIGGKPFVLNAGELILMPADIPHAVTALDRFKMQLIMIKSR